MTFIDQAIFPLTLVALLGAGLIAGVFFGFSAFVMKALGKIPAPSGIAAMQSINIVVINPVFLGVFMGTAIVSIVIIIALFFRWERSEMPYLLAGAVLYLIGTFAVTMCLNVPLNNKLAKLTPEDREAVDSWAHYLNRWTLWNHVRTAAALLSCGSFALALRCS